MKGEGEILEKDGFGCVVSAGGKAVALFKNSVFDENKAESSSSSDSEVSDGKHFPWGDTDDLPRKMAKAAELDTVVQPGIRFNAKMAFGAGVAYGDLIEDDDQGELFKIRKDPKIEEFFENNAVDLLQFDILYDLCYLSNAYVQIVLDKAGKNVVEANTAFSRANYVRVEKVKKGYPTKAFLNFDFGTTDYSPTNTKELPLLSPHRPWDHLRELAAKGKRRFIFRMTLPDGQRRYYPRADWFTAFESGWMDISKAIAKFKKHLMENQMSVKHLISFSNKYWPWRFGEEEWAKYPMKKKRELVQAEVDMISDFLSGSENAGKSLSTDKIIHDGKEYSLLTIEELPNNWYKEGMYVEDSQESSLNKFSALSIHPEIMGNTPGSSKMGGGSGSANRVAFNQRVSLSFYEQLISLSWLKIPMNINKWPHKSVRYRNSHIETLDTGGEMTKPNPNE